MSNPTSNSYHLSKIYGDPGSVLTLYGSNLLSVYSISFGTVPATLLTKTSSSITLQVPPSTQETVILVINSMTIPNLVFHYNVYQVSSLSRQIVMKGDILSIYGTRMNSIMHVEVEQVITPFVHVSDTELSLILPPSTLQYNSLKLNHREIATLTYVLVEVYVMSPQYAEIGDTIDLTGKGMRTVKHALVGTVPATLTIKDDSVLSLTIPNGFAKKQITLIDTSGQRTITFFNGDPLWFNYVPVSKCKTICQKSSYYYPSNQQSTKQLQSRMIQTHKQMTYNNSRMSTIYNDLLSVDYGKNRELLLRFKYKFYNCYMKNLITGNITVSKKKELTQMLNSLVSSLTETERRVVFDEPIPVVDETPMVESGYIFYVVYRSIAKSKYFMVKNISTDFLFEPFQSYVFDLSDASNLGTQLSFSESNQSIPYRGISYTNTPGTEGATMTLTIDEETPSSLYTFDLSNPIPLRAYQAGYSLPTISIRKLDSIVSRKEDYTYVNMRQYSNVAIYENSGPRYSINDPIRPRVLKELNRDKYNITYGTYYIDIPLTYATTLLNRGYEDSISWNGDIGKKQTMEVKGLQLAGETLDGVYDFYYGRVQLTVHKPFPFDMTLYSMSYGYMSGIRLLHFVEPYTPTEIETIVSLPFQNTLFYDTRITFNEFYAPSNRKYGVSMGIYLINLQKEVAFLTRGREEFVSILTTDTTLVSEGYSPEGVPCLYYTGDIQLHIKGYFESLSLCSKDGYSGGFKLLVYNAYYGADITFDPTHLTLHLKDKGIYFNQDLSLETYPLSTGEYLLFYTNAYPFRFLNEGPDECFSVETLNDRVFRITVRTLVVQTEEGTESQNFGTVRILIPELNQLFVLFTYESP